MAFQLGPFSILDVVTQQIPGAELEVRLFTNEPPEDASSLDAFEEPTFPGYGPQPFQLDDLEILSKNLWLVSDKKLAFKLTATLPASAIVAGHFFTLTHGGNVNVIDWKKWDYPISLSIAGQKVNLPAAIAVQPLKFLFGN